MNEAWVYGAMRIGRGMTTHPAFKDQNGCMTATCGCPNTTNGFGASNGQFFPGVKPTCKRSQPKIQWIPVPNDAWKAADDALIASHPRSDFMRRIDARVSA